MIGGREKMNDETISLNAKPYEIVDDKLLIGSKLRNAVLIKSTVAAALMSICGGMLYLRYLSIDFNLFDDVVMHCMLGVFFGLLAGLLSYSVWRYRCPKCKKFWVYLLKVQYTQGEQFSNKKLFWFRFCLHKIQYIREYLCHECGELRCSRGKSYSLIKQEKHETSR